MSLVLTAPPQVTIEGVGNAANYVAGKVSAGEILVVYGTDFGPDQVAGYTISNGAFTTSAGETRVYFDDVPAPMLYSASGQLSCIVPYSVTGRQTTRVQMGPAGVPRTQGNFQDLFDSSMTTTWGERDNPRQTAAAKHDSAN
ncbi:MAG: IPT/TIG domain-containing protein, partial [Phycisphaerae bacterium]